MTPRTKYRPRLKPPRSSLDNTLVLVATLGVVFGIIALSWFWPQLPDRIPSHFDAAGSPDAWGGKSALILLPAISCALYLMLMIFSHFPHIYNYPFPITERNAAKQYSIARAMLFAINAEIAWLFAYILWQSIQVALGNSLGLGPFFLAIFILIIFSTIGIYFWIACKSR